MNLEIKNYIGKSIFIEKYPLLFSFIVFFGSELGLIVTGLDEKLIQFNDHPVTAILSLLLKLIVIVIVTYAYLYIRSSSRKSTN
jgi:hypothetical protein